MSGVTVGPAFIACALGLVIAASCKGPTSEAVPVGETTPHDTMPPPLWFLQGTKANTCLWQHKTFASGGAGTSRELATFPSPCEEADLAWSQERAIAWLRGRAKDRIYVVTLGSAPVELALPEGQSAHAVGFDDVPLLFTTPSRSIADDVRAWAWDGTAWILREHGAGKRLDALTIWRDQRGETSRKRRTPQGLVPLAEEELAKLGDVPSPEREANRIGQAIADDQNRIGPSAFVVPPAAPSWWQLDAGGVPLAIRWERDRFVPDVRRRVNGTWQRPPAAAPTVDRMRLEIWRAGVETRGTWVLLTSDGRGGTLFDAKNGLKLWGSDTALSLFAP